MAREGKGLRGENLSSHLIRVPPVHFGFCTRARTMQLPRAARCLIYSLTPGGGGGFWAAKRPKIARSSGVFASGSAALTRKIRAHYLRFSALRCSFSTAELSRNWVRSGTVYNSITGQDAE
jgi:hypothetical protein